MSEEIDKETRANMLVEQRTALESVDTLIKYFEQKWKENPDIFSVRMNIGWDRYKGICTIYKMAKWLFDNREKIGLFEIDEWKETPHDRT